MLYLHCKQGKIYQGSALDVLKKMPSNSIHCCVSSPPYFGLRDYGDNQQIGSEKDPKTFLRNLIKIYDEIFRLLRLDGVCWVNLGDSYSSKVVGGGGGSGKQISNRGSRFPIRKINPGVKPKNLLGIPWRFALWMQKHNWILRQDIIWQKPSAMPEAIKDRCTRAHEYLFMFTKSANYYFEQLKEPSTEGALRNKRSIWTVSSSGLKNAHFATFPIKLIEPMIIGSCPKGGIVLDPFAGSGTTALASIFNHRKFIAIELSIDYIQNIMVPRLSPQLEQAVYAHYSNWDSFIFELTQHPKFSTLWSRLAGKA